jgi:cold shock CspA family protein
MSTYGRITSVFPLEGYGLIQPDDSSALVFVDVTDFGAQWRDLKPGTLVRFSRLQGIRSPKAYNVMILDNELSTADDIREPFNNSLGKSLVSDSQAPRSIHSLSRSEYEDEITRVLLSGVPGITVTQVSEVRDKLTEDAASRGWLE